MGFFHRMVLHTGVEFWEMSIHHFYYYLNNLLKTFDSIFLLS